MIYFFEEHVASDFYYYSGLSTEFLFGFRGVNLRAAACILDGHELDTRIQFTGCLIHVYGSSTWQNVATAVV